MICLELKFDKGDDLMQCKCGSEVFTRDRGILEEGYLIEYNEVCLNCNSVVANWSYGHYTIYEDNLMPENKEFEIEFNFVDGSTHVIYVEAVDEEEALDYATEVYFKINT